LVFEDFEDHFIENDIWIELFLTILVHIEKIFGNFVHVIVAIEFADLFESLEVNSATSSSLFFGSIQNILGGNQIGGGGFYHYKIT
jgi:hypothetical protein